MLAICNLDEQLARYVYIHMAYRMKGEAYHHTYPSLQDKERVFIHFVLII